MDSLQSDRAVARALAILTICTTLVVNKGEITGSDGLSMYDVGTSLADSGSLAVPPVFGVPGRHGLYYSRYGIGLPLVAAVAYALVKPFAGLGRDPDVLGVAAAAAMMPVIFGLLVAAIYRLSRRLGAGTRAASLAALGAVGGTYLLPYSKEFFSEPLTALCLIVSIEQALAERPGSAGAAAAAAGLTRPQAFAFAPVLMWWVWRRSSWPGLWRTTAALAAGAVATCAYNAARFGAPFNFGYSAEMFSTPFLVGTGGLLFHPAKSIFLFAPIALALVPALVRLARKDSAAFWLISWNLGVAFSMAATWESFAGGWCWGPRLLIIGVAPAFAAVAPWCEESKWRRNVVRVLFTAGALVSLPATVVPTRAQQLDQPPPPVGPSVVRQYELIPFTFAFTAHHLLHDAGGSRQYASLWQVRAARALGPRGLWAGAFITVLLLAGVGLSARTLRRKLTASGTWPI